MRWLVVIGLLIGCGDDSSSDLDGSVDSGGSDASSDAGVDAAREDVGVDAARDADVPDAPGDVGEDALMDAGVDAMDAAVEECSEEGAMRTAACGNCGVGQERCEAGVWTMSGPCLGEGECAAASLETRTTSTCGEETRLCNDTCMWLDWEATAPPSGECETGETRFVDDGTCGSDEHREQTCSGSCEWETTGACESVCGPLRSGPLGWEEVCVPAGSFIRGDDFFDDAPTSEVELTYHYAIDVYPVVYPRYAGCVAAGDCGTTFLDPADLDDPAFARTPAIRPIEDARAFCEWDGGRRLPTEAEWEKAMRGPVPRDDIYVVGDAWPCDELPRVTCPGVTSAPFPGIGLEARVVSFYGVRDQGVEFEYVSDIYDSDYYLDPSSLVDPTGPASGVLQAFKAGSRSLLGQRIGRRDGSLMGFGTRAALRCTRTIPSTTVRL